MIATKIEKILRKFLKDIRVESYSGGLKFERFTMGGDKEIELP